MAADGTARPSSPPPPCGVEKQIDGDGDGEGEEGMRKKQRVVVEVDRMGGLPEEVVMVIVNKLFNLKTLLRFSLVAKRYSSLVSLTHSLVVELPVLNRSSREAEAEAEAAAAVAGPSLALSQILSAIITHHRFQHIKHLHLHLRAALDSGSGNGNGNGNGLFPTSVAVFGSHLEQFQVLSAKSVNPIPVPASVFNASAFNVALMAGLNNAPALEEAAGLNNAAASVGRLKKKSKRILKRILSCASKQHAIIRRHVSQCKMIESAVFTDSSGLAALVMGKQQIAKLKASNDDHPPPPPPQLRVVHYYLPTLDLPKTGYTLKDVTFVAAMSGHDQDAKQHVQVMGGCEAEEMANGGHLDDFDFQKLNVFAEAAPLIFNHHVKKVTLYDFLCPYEQLLPKKDD